MQDIKVFKGTDYSGRYGVTEDGVVFSYPKEWIGGNGEVHKHEGKQLKPYINSNGYYEVGLSKDGKSYNYKIHQLVAHVYLTNPENKPQINHKDGNKLNNHISNLEWVSAKENTQHSFNNLLQIPVKGKSHGRARAVINLDTLSMFDTGVEASLHMGLGKNAVRNAIKQGTRAGGYYWNYLDLYNV